MPAVSPIVIMNESTIDCQGVLKTISPWWVDDDDDEDDDDDALFRIVIRLVWLSDDEWEDDDDELLISYASNMR